MFKNYFKVAVRNLFRNRFFSALNIFGLAISMTICMAIIMLVADQMTYDRHNPEHQRIFRINSVHVDKNNMVTGGTQNATSPMPLKEEIVSKYTGVEKAVRIRRGFGNNWLEVENQNVNIPLKGYFADPGTLKFFGHELEYGDEETALQAPYSVVLTKKAAKKLFNEDNPIGMTIKIGDVGTYTVTGVLKDNNHKSHLVFEALASMSSAESLRAEGKGGDDLNNWLDFWNGWTYILVEEGISRSTIETHLEDIFLKHIAPAGNVDTYRAKFNLQALTDITPGPLVNNPIGPSLPWAFVYFLGGLAIVIMLTSCFNFMNLSVARSLKRAKEIGVRKVTGALRSQLFVQFLTESVVVSFCALLFSLLLLYLFKPLMMQLTFAQLFMWDLEANYMVFAIFVVFAVVVGILAGFFPAVVMSGFQPISVLKGLQNTKLFSRMGLRKLLLVSQFTLSLIFILTVIVMHNQLQLFLHSDYGFNMKENIMLRLNQTSAENLKTELLKYPSVINATATSHVPAAGETHGSSFKQDLSDVEWTNINTFSVDEAYLENMQVELIAGEFFKENSGASNKNFIVINEQALKVLKYDNPADALGKTLIHQYDSTTKQIIGVIKNYNHSQLFRPIEALGLMYHPHDFRVIQIRYAGDRATAAKHIEEAWSKVNPGLKIDYKDVEAEIKYFYNTIFGDVVNILGFVATLAIIISCMGLLGMATYSIETRMKEISLRKVLGSSDKALIVLLSRSFIKLLLIAVIIGVPLAYFLNNFWLQFIAHHTTFNVGVVAIGTAVLLFLGAITVGSQTVRAAFANPVDNLKNE